MIDQNKIVFITLDWMKEYKGITKDDVPFDVCMKDYLCTKCLMGQIL